MNFIAKLDISEKKFRIFRKFRKTVILANFTTKNFGKLSGNFGKNGKVF